MSMTRRTAAEVAAVRHLRRALADLSSEPTLPRYAADVRGARAPGPSRPATADHLAAARRGALYGTLGKGGLVVVGFGGGLVALSSRHGFNASAALVVLVVGVALAAGSVAKCWWDVAHLPSRREGPVPRPDGALQRAGARWRRFAKQGELTDVPLTGRTGRTLVRPDDEWWTSRNE